MGFLVARPEHRGRLVLAYDDSRDQKLQGSGIAKRLDGLIELLRFAPGRAQLNQPRESPVPRVVANELTEERLDLIGHGNVDATRLEVVLVGGHRLKLNPDLVE